MVPEPPHPAVALLPLAVPPPPRRPRLRRRSRRRFVLLSSCTALFPLHSSPITDTDTNFYSCTRRRSPTTTWASDYSTKRPMLYRIQFTTSRAPFDPDPSLFFVLCSSYDETYCQRNPSIFLLAQSRLGTGVEAPFLSELFLRVLNSSTCLPAHSCSLSCPVARRHYSCSYDPE